MACAGKGQFQGEKYGARPRRGVKIQLIGTLKLHPQDLRRLHYSIRWRHVTARRRRGSLSGSAARGATHSMGAERERRLPVPEPDRAISVPRPGWGASRHQAQRRRSWRSLRTFARANSGQAKRGETRKGSRAIPEVGGPAYSIGCGGGAAIMGTLNAPSICIDLMTLRETNDGNGGPLARKSSIAAAT